MNAAYFRMLISRAVIVGIGIASACVDARPEDPMGQAQYVASGAIASNDFAAAAVLPGVAPAIAGRGAGPTTPIPTSNAGTGNITQPPSAAPVAGASAPPLSSTGAAGSGTAGRSSGAAGMSAAAGAAPIPAGTGAGGAPPSAGGPAPAGGQGTLTVDFKTVTSGGTYAPRNVGAVWIETASGMFVKTLEKWGQIRSNHLTRWNMASGGWGSIFGGGNTADMMDAVSRATLRSHEMHHDTWNMKDATGKVVADGMYNLVIECTEDNLRAAPSGSVAFMKGPAPQMLTAPDKSPFSGFSLNYTP